MSLLERYVGFILLTLGYVLAIAVSIVFGLKLYRKASVSEEGGGK